MTPDQFRKIALGFPDTEERSHMNHPDFRVRGKIFATLGVPDKDHGMVKLTPETQRLYVELDPNTFVPVKGGWGLGGATNVRLKTANAARVEEALAAAVGQAILSPVSKKRQAARPPVRKKRQAARPPVPLSELAPGSPRRRPAGRKRRT